MSYWITVFVWAIVLLLIAEECLYYFWNRYVYGPNLERRRKWKNRMLTVREKGKAIIFFFKKKPQPDIQETKKEKSSM